MAFETEGIVHKVFETENKTASFQAREFVIKLEGNYPQFIKFQLTQDKCDIISNYKEGDKIKVHFDLRGREWNEKYFTNLNAWKVESVAQDAPVEASGPPQEFSPIENSFETSSKGQDSIQAEDFGDLPF